MSQTQLITRYRPISFNEVVGNTEIIKALADAVHSESCPHDYLFTGCAGIGKTSLARIIAKEINASINEVDAASHSSVEDTRLIVEASGFTSIMLQQNKMYIIDECHNLSRKAWEPLLKLIEDPPSSVFVSLCTTDPKNIPDTDPMYKKRHIVEEFDKDNMIFYGQWSLPWPMWHRDFCYIWSKSWTKEGLGIGAAVSVNHPKYLEGEGDCKGHVRGEIIETGVVVRDLGKPEDLKSEFSYIVCVNPRGWIPNFLINIVASDQALNVSRTIKYWNEKEDKDPKAPKLPN